MKPIGRWTAEFGRLRRHAYRTLPVGRWHAGHRLATHEESHLRQRGWFESYLYGQARDAECGALPWLTYSFIDFISPRLNKQMKLFEYGSGASTRWWAARVGSVIACEHDPQWAEHVRENLPDNAKVIYRSLSQGYADEITHHNLSFDIVVIDGRDRVNCARFCRGLKEEAVIIWDNADLEGYADGFEILHNRGYKRIDFTGMGPINLYGWSTAVFYHPNNCLDI